VAHLHSLRLGRTMLAVAVTLLPLGTLGAWSDKPDVLSSNHTIRANAVGDHSKDVALMIMKGTRTASTFFCLELNKRGIHVSQEAMLDWDSDAQMLHVSPDEHMTPASRRAWIVESLKRPMPKTPLAIERACMNVNYDFLPRKKALGCLAADQLKSNACVPPYTDAKSCSDLHGCFQQTYYQRICFTDSSEPTVYGISFDFRATMSVADLSKVSWDEAVDRRVAVYQDIVKEVAPQRQLKVVAQARTNLARWAVSMSFHKAEWGEDDANCVVDSKVDVENQKEEQRKIFVKNPIAMFNDMAQDFLSQLKTVRRYTIQFQKLKLLTWDTKRVDNAVCVFYEDLSRNVSLVALKGTVVYVVAYYPYLLGGIESGSRVPLYLRGGGGNQGLQRQEATSEQG